MSGVGFFTASNRRLHNSSCGEIALNNSIEPIKPGPLCEDAHKMPAAGHEDVLVNLVTITTAQSYFRSYGISACTDKVDSAVTAVTEKWGWVILDGEYIASEKTRQLAEARKAKR